MLILIILRFMHDIQGSCLNFVGGGITKFDSEMTLNFVRNRVYESEYD